MRRNSIESIDNTLNGFLFLDNLVLVIGKTGLTVVVELVTLTKKLVL